MVDETAVDRHKARIAYLEDILDQERNVPEQRRAEIEDALAHHRDAIKVLRSEAPEPKAGPAK